MSEKNEYKLEIKKDSLQYGIFYLFLSIWGFFGSFYLGYTFGNYVNLFHAFLWIGTIIPPFIFFVLFIEGFREGIKIKRC